MKVRDLLLKLTEVPQNLNVVVRDTHGVITLAKELIVGPDDPDGFEEVEEGDVLIEGERA